MVITVCNFKGGVGKTTTCHALATLKGMDGYKVLCIDLDTQHSLSTCCGVKINDFDEDIVTIVPLIMAEIEKVPYDDEDIEEAIVHLKYIDILPSTFELAMCDRALAQHGYVTVLDKLISKIKHKYDYIFIDCPPSNKMTIDNALVASDSVIIPVECYFLGAEGLSLFLKNIQDIKEEFNPKIYIEGVILTMYQKSMICNNIVDYIKNITNNTTSEHLEITKKLNSLNLIVFKAIVPRSVKVSEASLYSLSIVEYLPKNPVSVAYREISNQIQFRKEKNHEKY